MRNDAPAQKVFQRIINQAKTNLNELCDFWNIYDVSSQVKYTFFRQKVHTFEEGISPQECQFSQ